MAPIRPFRPPRRGPTPAVLGVVGLLVLLVPGGRAQAQDARTFRLDLDRGSGGVEVRLGGVLDGRGFRDALESGLPLRLHLITELWRDRFLDAQEGRHEWRATIRFDPLSELYRVESGEGPVGTASDLPGTMRLLQEHLEVPLRPGRPGRFYYLARLEIETLSLSDLEELRRWLQGDADRVGGDEEGEVGGFLVRGLRRLFVRTLALPVRQFEARTPRFDWEG